MGVRAEEVEIRPYCAKCRFAGCSVQVGWLRLAQSPVQQAARDAQCAGGSGHIAAAAGQGVLDHLETVVAQGVDTGNVALLQ